MSPKNIRIKDIARLVGLSKGTVDRVLHNRGRVSDKSFQKVMKVLQEIDYRPNLIARTLSGSRNYRLLALLPSASEDAYWAATREGILQAETEWRQYNINIEIIAFDQYDKASFREKSHAAFLAQPDGLITAPIFHDEALPLFQLLSQNGIPYVLFNTNIPGVQPACFIGQDSYSSGQVAAGLMYRGQREGGKLAVLHLDEDIHNSVHLPEKERGFREFFQQKSPFAFEITAFSLKPHEAEFAPQINALLADPELRGIFVSTSKGTSAVASLLEKRSKPPITLIGYDIIEDNLKYLRLGIIDFLINQNPKRQAYLAVGHLANLLLFKKKAPERQLFPLEVITQQNLDSYLASESH